MSFKHTLRVRYAETDQMGIVYHANYLTWFEISRTEFIRSLGLSYRSIENQGILLPVAEAHCKYLLPAHYDDLVEVRLTVSELRAASILFQYEVFRPADATLLARGWTRQAFVNKELRPVNAKRLCPEIWAALEQHLISQ